MHLHFERNNTRCDCSILSLSWMGTVPDDIPEHEDWMLNRQHYYEDGWLATANVRGVVGVTYTTSNTGKKSDHPVRTNYNLRGHRADVVMVKWNEPYQKLASCDSSGVIFVWIKYDGRWSIELINDRSTPVTHFSWSHDGRMALICYQDGFVLVGSVSGQRYWSSMLNLDATINCGMWTPDDQQVYFGTDTGQIIVMDVHGAMVSQVQLSSEVGIIEMVWSCERFKMEDEDDEIESGKSKQQYVLAVSLQSGSVYLLKSFDDVSPSHIETGLAGGPGLIMEWSNSKRLLAVGGTLVNSSGPNSNIGGFYHNVLKFYTDSGNLLYSARIPHDQSPVSAMTWGHNDLRIFVATGSRVHVACVQTGGMASLQLLCSLKVQNCIRCEAHLSRLQLPSAVRAPIEKLFSPTIRCCVPDSTEIRDFVSRPPSSSTRLHCTMIRHDDDLVPAPSQNMVGAGGGVGQGSGSGSGSSSNGSSGGGGVSGMSGSSGGTCYTLYLEYLGGLVPLLKGRRTSKIRPEFVIFDPQACDADLQLTSFNHYGSSSNRPAGRSEDTTDDSSVEEGCGGSPRAPRRMRRRRKREQAARSRRKKRAGFNDETQQDSELMYTDTLPEDTRLVEVTSNIWGTKFKIHGLASTVPANLGQVTYKTSLLHLQPRQMTLVITELRDDFPIAPDPSYNPNLFSEDEEDITATTRNHQQHQTTVCVETSLTSTIATSTSQQQPVIAPMTPRTGRFSRSKKNSMQQAQSQNSGAALARAESYEDEFPYVDISEMVNFSEALRSSTSSSSSTNNQPSISNNISHHQNVISHPQTLSYHMPSYPRHSGVSPLCCEGSVPSLQSPRNAVAASDTIFDRPAAESPQQQQMIVKNCTTATGLMSNCSNSVVGGRYCRRKERELKTRPSDVIKFIDEESPLEPQPPGIPINSQSPSNIGVNSPIPAGVNTAHRTGVPRVPTALSIAPLAMVRSCSAGFLDAGLMTARREVPKRLVLVDKDKKKSRKPVENDVTNSSSQSERRCVKLKCSGKSRSLDSSDIFAGRSQKNEITAIHKNEKDSENEKKDDGNGDYASIAEMMSGCPIDIPKERTTRETAKLSFFTNSSNAEPLSSSVPTTSYERNCSLRKTEKDNSCSICRKDELCSCRNTDKQEQESQSRGTLELLLARMRDLESTVPKSRHMNNQNNRHLPHSSPSSPAPSKKGKRNQSASPIRKHILNSPLLNRRRRKSRNTESSDDEINGSGNSQAGGGSGRNYRDLETFQKAQLRQKLKRGKIEPNGNNFGSPPAPLRREFVMHNKAPMWNENSQVYQLDFGGRVTQESAKNFQIEFRGKQVMQFGRIDGNAYTLDFQYPFSALQAFAVALANVTQRLK